MPERISRVPVGGACCGSESIGRRHHAADVTKTKGKESRMEWRIIALNFVYAVLGVVLMFLSYRVIDWLTPTIDFASELRKGNLAVGLFIAAIFLGIAIIIGGALN